PKEFLELLAAEQVTVLNQTPSAFYQLVQSYAQNTVNLALRYIVFGGEALEFSRLEDWYRLQTGPGPQLINMYGITETTVHVTYQPLDTDWARSGAGSQIGCNIPDLRIYVLDENLEPAPTGVIGEMYVAGAGLARGYLHAPALTAERFVADPHGPAGTRMYRTGDLARRQRDGNLEYLGRIDQQVKIRGFRIELGEIEAALLAQPEVAQAAVVLRETAAGSSQLVAYIVPNTGASPDSTALRKALGNRLPDYMIPAALVALPALPLTTSGKLNRAALPEPERQRGDYLAPRTPKEELLCSLTAELLSMERVGSNDNFFSIGGDSIVAIMLANRAAKAGLSFSPRDIFQNPTMAGLAEVANFTAGATYTRANATTEAQPTPIMHWLLERRGPIGRYCQSILLRVPLTLQESALRSGLAAIVRTHSALRVALVEEQGDWKLQIPASTGQVSLHIDAGEFTEAVLHSAEARLNVRSGNMFEAVWFPAAGRLLLVIHHIAVDGVSWRILMGDLAAA
ncbi:MAG: AMP-binding protein, partial [Gammaproteobacteria bacterium]|nr:AMP-binding protein [Gammaproteobacteria bacterium]